jgi:hypothetical protein
MHGQEYGLRSRYSAQCRAFLGQRRDREDPGPEQTQNRDGGLKMDWAKPALQLATELLCGF